ncbi:ribonuclease H-like domain-containing protein [Lactarius psammicola]|nr:ribonuclease H-like domain-containing protein [Lactarius psammicola]
MITTSDKVYMVKVYDTTVEKKTADNLLVMMTEVLDVLKYEWGVTPIAFTTDASGESQKARRLLRAKRDELVTPDCYAHQINLIVGDYFKTNGIAFLHYASEANDLITWLRSKTVLIGLIKAALVSHGRRALSVIWPVPTRWTAYYLAYRRLLDLRSTLEFIIADDAQKAPEEQQIIPLRDRAAREKAQKMVAIIKNPSFWLALARIKHHLAPLAVAANITQSSHCRLDEVLMTFASLVMQYSKLTDSKDMVIRKALLESIEKRWEASDQNVFIASVILNPFLKTNPFKRDARLISLGAIHTLLSGLWTRFYPGDPCPDELYEEIHHYLGSSDFYSTMPGVCQRLKASAASKAHFFFNHPNPLDVYADITISGEPSTPLIRLATHVLSICPNSASCERLFSTFGLILTKLRTHLNNQHVVDLAECKMHIRDEHLEKEVKCGLRKRLFGALAENPATQTHSMPSTPVLPASDLFSSQAAAPPPVPKSTESLHMLTQRHIAMLDENVHTDMDNTAAGANNINYSTEKRMIVDRFDFSSDTWTAFFQRSAMGSLEDEMELYDLLDLDAEGDLDYDLDDCVESIFTS